MMKSSEVWNDRDQCAEHERHTNRKPGHPRWRSLFRRNAKLVAHHYRQPALGIAGHVMHDGVEERTVKPLVSIHLCDLGALLLGLVLDFVALHTDLKVVGLARRASGAVTA